MSFKVKKLVVGKGRTSGNEQNGEWIREYYELEVEIPDEHELSMAKECVEGLLNEWLGIPKEAPQQKWSWNPSAIKWVETEGFKGKYQRYPGAEEKAESASDYRLLLEDLKKHDGRLSRDGWFYWLFEDGSTIGRKQRKASAEG